MEEEVSQKLNIIYKMKLKNISYFNHFPNNHHWELILTQVQHMDR